MTEFEKLDKNGNGTLEPDEFQQLELDNLRRQVIDSDLKRDTQRRLTTACAAGMLLYPLVILIASGLGFDKAAELISNIAAVYVVAASGVVEAYFGFNAMEAKK